MIRYLQNLGPHNGGPTFANLTGRAICEHKNKSDPVGTGNIDQVVGSHIYMALWALRGIVIKHRGHRFITISSMDYIAIRVKQASNCSPRHLDSGETKTGLGDGSLLKRDCSLREDKTVQARTRFECHRRSSQDDTLEVHSRAYAHGPRDDPDNATGPCASRKNDSGVRGSGRVPAICRIHAVYHS